MGDIIMKSLTNIQRNIVNLGNKEIIDRLINKQYEFIS